MKDFLIMIVATIPILFFEAIVCMVYTGFVESMLSKNRAWVRFLAIWAGLLLFQTGIYTWLPGKLNIEISYFDGIVKFVDGALIMNLAFVLFLHSAGIALAALGHLWKAIRKKVKLNGKFVLLELAITVILIFIGVKLVNRAEAEPVTADQGKAGIMTVIGILLMLWGYSNLKKNIKQAGQKKETTVPQRSVKPTQPAIPAGSPQKQFAWVVAEKDRLKALGDYASQIPLLTQATELDVDRKSKARIWNYLGMAHEQMKSPQKAEECYRSALRFDKENPASHNNLALILSDRGDHVTALKHMEAAILAAKARKQEMGIYYGNYALIAGKGGNLSRAEDYLILAKNAGYNDSSIQEVRRQLRMK